MTSNWNKIFGIAKYFDTERKYDQLILLTRVKVFQHIGQAFKGVSKRSFKLLQITVKSLITDFLSF